MSAPTPEQRERGKDALLRALRTRYPGRPVNVQGWVRQLYNFWLDGRDLCGIAWANDYIGPSQHVSYLLKRLVADGRAERRRRPGRHPEYRAVMA